VPRGGAIGGGRGGWGGGSVGVRKERRAGGGGGWAGQRNVGRRSGGVGGNGGGGGGRGGGGGGRDARFVPKKGKGSFMYELSHALSLGTWVQGADSGFAGGGRNAHVDRCQPNGGAEGNETECVKEKLGRGQEFWFDVTKRCEPVTGGQENLKEDGAKERERERRRGESDEWGRQGI